MLHQICVHVSADACADIIPDACSYFSYDVNADDALTFPRTHAQQASRPTPAHVGTDFQADVDTYAVTYDYANVIADVSANAALVLR